MSFAFPRIELDDGRPGAGNKHGKKPSKEVLLKIAEAKQKEKQEAGEDAKVWGECGAGCGARVRGLGLVVWVC